MSVYALTCDKTWTLRRGVRAMADIAAFIRDFMREHRLTAKKLAALIGLRSAAALQQLAAGKGGGADAVEFEQAMVRNFVLTAAEREELGRCVMAAAADSEGDVIRTREMWAYLRGETLQKGSFYLETPSTGAVTTLRERYARAKNLRITLLNTPYSTIYPELEWLMKECDAHIDHYVTADDDDARTIRLTSDVRRPIMYPNYECYVRVEEKNEQCCYGLARADLMICAWEDGGGELWRDLVVFTAPDRARLMARPGVAGLMNAIGIEKEKYMRIKRSYHGVGSLDDYVHMVETYAEMERDSAIYAIKPDLCVASVPPDTLRDAALSGGMMTMNDETEQAIERLTRLFEQRYANLEQKRKRTWLFLKRDAMERFARTGLMSGHFWGLRPFTPEERRRILAEQLRIMRVNPGYRLFFLRGDCGVRDIDVCSCERFGTLISNGSTDYDLSNGYTEVLLGHKKFTRLFESFVQEKLLAQSSGEQETRSIIKNLIAIAAEVGD